MSNPYIEISLSGSLEKERVEKVMYDLFYALKEFGLEPNDIRLHRLTTGFRMEFSRRVDGDRVLEVVNGFIENLPKRERAPYGLTHDWSSS